MLDKGTLAAMRVAAEALRLADEVGRPDGCFENDDIATELWDREILPDRVLALIAEVESWRFDAGHPLAEFSVGICPAGDAVLETYPKLDLRATSPSDAMDIYRMIFDIPASVGLHANPTKNRDNQGP